MGNQLFAWIQKPNWKQLASQEERVRESRKNLMGGHCLTLHLAGATGSSSFPMAEDLTIGSMNRGMTLDWLTPAGCAFRFAGLEHVFDVQIYGKDEYGRTLADVVLPDGTNVNHELVKGGWCWWYRKYAPGDTVLGRLEKESREAKKGLWVDPQPVPPWEWRKQRK